MKKRSGGFLAIAVNAMINTRRSESSPINWTGKPDWALLRAVVTIILSASAYTVSAFVPAIFIFSQTSDISFFYCECFLKIHPGV